MASRKKKANWEAIRALYLQGVTPTEISNDYDVTSKQVRDRCYREKWKLTRATISDKIASDVHDELKSLSTITIRVHMRFMQQLEEQMDKITNPYLLDGERTNSLYQTAMNNSVKLTQAILKDQPIDEEEPAGFNVSPDECLRA